MKARILSDLHFDAAGMEPLPPAGFDCALVAGDARNGNPAELIESLLELLPEPSIFFVPGNHEGYGFPHWPDLAAALREAAEGTRVRVLSRESALFGGVRILGATLWTDFCLFGFERRDHAMEAAHRRYADFRRVGVAGAALRPSDALRFHQQDLAFLQSRLSVPFEGPTVVMTHHSPRRESVPALYRHDIGSAFFSSHLDDGLLAKADLWVHGHTHSSFSYRVGGCRVVSNPRGYLFGDEPENPAFDPAFFVDIPSAEPSADAPRIIGPSS